MEIVKNIASVLGLITAFGTVLSLLSKTFRRWVSYVVTKNSKEDRLEKIGSSLEKLQSKNDNLLNEVTKLGDELHKHIDEQEQDKMFCNRQKIVEFADKIAGGKKPSREYTDSILEVIDEYLEYCDEHPNFPNQKAVLSIEIIQDYYLKFQ